MPERTPNLDLRALSRRELPHPFNSLTLCKLEKAGVPRVNSLVPQTVPPAEPATLDAYYVQQGDPSSVWAGYEEVLATWTGGSWVTIPLRPGFFAWVLNEGLAKTYLGVAEGWVGFNENIVITKQFETIYDQAVVNGFYGKTYLGYRQAPGTTSGVLGPISSLIWRATANSLVTTEGFAPPLYPLYRYTGTQFLTGNESASMPSILSGRLRAYTTNGELLSTPPIEIVNSSAESIPSLYQLSIGSAVLELIEYSGHETVQGPEEDIQVLATLPGLQPDSLSYKYEEEFQSLASSLVPGYVCLRFQPGAFTPGANYVGDNTRYKVVLEIELSISSNF